MTVLESFYFTLGTRHYNMWTVVTLCLYIIEKCIFSYAFEQKNYYRSPLLELKGAFHCHLLQCCNFSQVILSVSQRDYQWRRGRTNNNTSWTTFMGAWKCKRSKISAFHAYIIETKRIPLCARYIYKSMHQFKMSCHVMTSILFYTR